ncbi:MAG: MATE family efflux transporter, partial [Clostridia bacterium]
TITFPYAYGLGVAGTSLVGQMHGQKRPDLSQLYGKVTQRMAMCVAFVLMSIIIALRYPLVSLFAKEPDVLAMAAQVMLMVAIFQPFQTSAVVLSGCLRGAGDTRFVAVVMIVCVALIRPIASLVAIHVLGFGLMGAWAASLCDMILRLVCVYRRFSSGKWFHIKV